MDDVTDAITYTSERTNEYRNLIKFYLNTTYGSMTIPEGVLARLCAPFKHKQKVITNWKERIEK